MGASDAKNDSSHAAAATEFAERVRTRDVAGLEELVLFGSTARGEASGLSSDVDFLAVVSDAVDRRTIEEQLLDVAYDVMLDVGPVVEVHVLSRSTFDRQRRQGRSFVRRAIDEGESYV